MPPKPLPTDTRSGGPKAAEPTVRDDLAEALEMMGEAIGLAAYRKAAADLGRIPVAETAFKHARLALARHHAEPEEKP